VKSWYGGVLGPRAVTGDDNCGFIFFFEGLLFATADEVGYANRSKINDMGRGLMGKNVCV
jgi:hypothetical protein